jgi:hypothetical protein
MIKYFEKFLDERFPSWRGHRRPELTVDKAKMKESLKANRNRRTVRVKSALP